MRLMTLADMVTELRAEARISSNLAHGVQNLPAQKALLRRIQEELYLAHDWPSLRMVKSLQVQAGSRYIEYPEGIDPFGLDHVYTRDSGNILRPLLYGIGIEQLNVRDSDEGAQGFPIARYQNYVSPAAETLNQNMFEVWPVPDRDTVLRFAGRRKLFPLINDGDVSTLDGPLIVLNAAAELLAGNKSEDAALKMQRAKDRLDLLKRRDKTSSSPTMSLSGGSKRRPPRPGIDYIPG